MSKEKLVPKLRFKEFRRDNIWELKSLEETVGITMGQSPSSKNYTSNPSDYILVQGNSDLKNGKVSPRIWTTQVTKKANKGDLILSVRAPVGDVGKTDFDVVLGRGVAAITGNEFIFQLLTKMKVNNYWTNLITGSTFESINSNDIKNAKVFFPRKEEQNKIGSFFKQLDEMIQLQQSKVNKVKDIKSAYLSEMFPKEGEKYPKKRFEGFTEPWTAKKLGSLLDYEQPTNYLVKSDSYDDSYLTPVLTAGKSFLLGYTNETEGIYKADNNNGVIIFDDFTTSSHFVDFDFKVKSSAMKFLRTNQSNFNLYFLYNLLTSINYSPESHERHWISIFSEFEVLIPMEKEQEKIGQFFKNLDNQISIEEEKLAKLEKLKQAYLNDMFV